MDNLNLELNLIENKKKVKRNKVRDKKQCINDFYQYLENYDLSIEDVESTTLDDCICDLFIDFVKMFKILKKLNNNQNYDFIKKIVEDIIENSLNINDELDNKKKLIVSEFKTNKECNLKLTKKY